MIARKITRRLSQLRRDVVDRTGWTARQIRRELGSAIEPGGSATHVLIAPPGAGNIGDQAMVEAFPRQVWVRGEIQQFHASRNQHVYFELVEKDGNRDRIRAALRVALFRNDRPAVTRALKEVPGVKLTDGVEVRIRGRVDFYPPTGRLQLVMNGIDPEGTPAVPIPPMIARKTTINCVCRSRLAPAS